MTKNPFPPIFTADGESAKLRLTPEQIDANADLFSLIVRRKRTGEVTRAVLKSQMSLDIRPNSRVGMTWLEPLDSGRVWAMRYAARILA